MAISKLLHRVSAGPLFSFGALLLLGDSPCEPSSDKCGTGSGAYYDAGYYYYDDGADASPTSYDASQGTTDGGTGGQCNGIAYESDKECAGPDTSSASYVQCRHVDGDAPTLEGGTWPGDGTYTLTDCLDHGGTGGAGGTHFVFKWVFTVSGTAWKGTYTTCTLNTAITSHYFMTANVQPNNQFIALTRTCGTGFVTGTPYAASGNTVTVSFGATVQGETEHLVFTKK